VAPVSDVPDMVGKKISVRSWHDGSQKIYYHRWTILGSKAWFTAENGRF
jgi:hypothetical protein